MDISELCLEAFPTHFSWLMTVSWNADVMRVEHIYCSKHLVLQQQHQQQISISVSNIRLDNKEADWFPLIVELLKRSLTGKCNSPVWSVGTVVRFQVYKYLTVVVLYIYAINTIYRVKTCTVCRIQSLTNSIICFSGLDFYVLYVFFELCAMCYSVNHATISMDNTLRDFSILIISFC